SDQLNEVIVATIHDVVGWKRDWRPQINLRHVVKERHAFRHDAANEARPSIDIYLAPHKFWIAAKLPLPQTIAQQHDAMLAPPLVFGKKVLAQDRSDMQHWEEIRGNARALDPLRRLISNGKIYVGVEKTSEVLEGLILIAIRAIVRKRAAGPRNSLSWPGREEHDQPIRLRIRKRTKQHCVD